MDSSSALSCLLMRNGAVVGNIFITVLHTEGASKDSDVQVAFPNARLLPERLFTWWESVF